MSAEKPFSTLLKLLLVAAKKKETESFDVAFVSKVLAEEYYNKLKAKEAFHLCLKAFMEALEYEQFQIPYRHDPFLVIEELINSPSKVYGKAWEHGGIWPSLRDSFTFEEYYNYLISHILVTLRLTRVDWCRDQLPELCIES